MAVTAHYIGFGDDGRWAEQSVLLAFQHVSGAHSGAHIAQEFFKIIQEAGVAHKVRSLVKSCFTVTDPSHI